MRKVWKPADAYIKAEWSSGPVPEPVRCIYQCDLLPEPEISGNATGICAEVVPKRVQMCVRVCMCNVLFQINSLLAETEITPPPPPEPGHAILERPMSKFKKQAGRHLPPRVYSSNSFVFFRAPRRNFPDQRSPTTEYSFWAVTVFDRLDTF